jgi:plasmid stability protein
MVPDRLAPGATMPTLTIKNLSASLHRELVARAKRNHRSLNNELISCLEHIFLGNAISVENILRDAREIRQRLGSVDHLLVDRYKHEG